MKTDHTLTAEELRSLVSYSDGNLYWRESTPQRTDGAIGTPSGRKGRLQAHIGGTARYVHRLIWLYHHGEWPSDQIDHINGNMHDNRIENLRVVTGAQNVQNITTTTSASGYRGVTYDGRHGTGRPWRARIMRDGRSYDLGYHATPEEAHDAYIAAKRSVHPFWAEHAA